MPRLNIPLNKRKAAHRRRWAVWPLIVYPLLIMGVCVIIFGWFTRDSLAKNTPEDTYAVIHLNPTNNSWSELLKYSAQTPLIYGYPLTLEHLAPFIKGEFALFERQGTTSVIGFKGKFSEEAKLSLDRLGLFIEERQGNTFVYAEPVEFNKNTYAEPKLSFSSVFKLGDLIILGNPAVVAPISHEKDALAVQLGQPMNASVATLVVPETNIFALKIDKNELNETGYTEISKAILSEHPAYQQLGEILFQYGGTVMLNDSAKDTAFHLALDERIPDVDAAEIHSNLENSLNFNTRERELRDGTTVLEITTQNTELEVQEISLGDSVAKIGPTITIINDQDRTVITNEPDIPSLLTISNKEVFCAKNPQGSADPNRVYQYFAGFNKKYTQNRLLGVLNLFVEVSLDKNGKSSLFRLCI